MLRPFRIGWVGILLLLCGTPSRADIILLLSDEKQAFSSVADAIAAHQVGAVERYNLGNAKPAQTAAVVDAIVRSDKDVVVAIGLIAAKLARQHLSTKQVVFCQVLNYEQFDLVTPWMRGVSAIPPMSLQFRAWFEADARLKRVGVITGRNMDALVAEGRTAAKALGIELVHEEVSSDREVMFALRRMADEVQGLWLAPDSSILSSQLLTELMAFGVKHGLEIMVFTPELLRGGALLSVSANTNDIAAQVLQRVEAIQAGKHGVGAAVTPLTKVRVEINEKVAARLGLKITVPPVGAEGEAEHALP